MLSRCHTTTLGTGRLFQGELLFNVYPGLKHLGYSVWPLRGDAASSPINTSSFRDNGLDHALLSLRSRFIPFRGEKRSTSRHSLATPNASMHRPNQTALHCGSDRLRPAHGTQLCQDRPHVCFYRVFADAENIANLLIASTVGKI
jgi:hypothetical protein